MSNRKTTTAPPTTVTRGFDFSAAIRRICRDMTARLPQLSHIDMSRVAVAVAQTRKPVAHGIYASLTPLRFENGATEGDVNGHRMCVQQVTGPDGVEMLYILTVYLPRFMEVDLVEKLVTIVHELWHISPAFDGDIRRFEGRCYAHSGSQKEYDAQMEVFVGEWLERRPPEYLYAFLRLNFQQLQTTYGGVYGMKIRKPRLLPVRASSNSRAS